MKYIWQCLVKFLDHINIPNFYLSSLDGNTTLKNKIFKFMCLKKKSFNKMILYLFFKLYYTKKGLKFFKKKNLNGRFVLFEVIRSHQVEKQCSLLNYAFVKITKNTP